MHQGAKLKILENLKARTLILHVFQLVLYRIRELSGKEMLDA
jgi:hypothetical protein